MNLTAWSVRNIKPIIFVTLVLCMAGAAIYLASAAGSWVTGTVLTVDGGHLAKL